MYTLDYNAHSALPDTKAPFLVLGIETSCGKLIHLVIFKLQTSLIAFAIELARPILAHHTICVPLVGAHTDDTAAAVVRSDGTILSNVVSSQVTMLISQPKGIIL